MPPLVLWLVACATTPLAPARTHDAYVLERAWSEDLREAVAAGDEVLDGFRVQAVAVDHATWTLPDDVLPTLAGRRATPVARIEAGARVDASLGRVLGSVVNRWRALGVKVDAVEVDHDCPIASLASYADALAEVREALPRDVALWVTVLPGWLDAPQAVKRVRTAVDGTVLHVHAVEASLGSPHFDPDAAEQWVRRYAALGSRPFRVALPVRGVHVDADGRLAASDQGMPVAAAPDDERTLLGALRQAPPRGWVGTDWAAVPAKRGGWTVQALASVLGTGPANDGVADAASGRCSVAPAEGEGCEAAEAPAP
ncbi:MAG: DUF3142 domain-containing protein [Myxococcota bacterium]